MAMNMRARRLAARWPAVAAVLAAVAWSACGAAEGPLRIVLPGTSDSRGLPHDDLTPLVVLHLRDRLAGVEGVRVVSDDRALPVLSSLASGAKGSLVPSFSACLPVDAIVRVSYAPGECVVEVHTAADKQVFRYPVTAKSSPSATVLAAAVDVAKAAGLGPEATRRLQEPVIAPDALFSVYHRCRVMWADWPMNPGEFRIKALEGFVPLYPTNLYLCARLVADTAVLLRSKSRGQEYAEPALRLARLSFPNLLGTTFEEHVFELAAQKSDGMEPDLLALAKGLVAGDTLESALDGLDDGGKDPMSLGVQLDAGAADRLGKASRAQRLGALRVLGVFKSKAAQDMVRKAAAGEKPDMRAAAARALGRADWGLDELKRLVGDPDAGVAFAAGYGLWKRGQADPRLIALARAGVAVPEQRSEAAEMLAALAEAGDAKLLREFEGAADAAIHRAAADALFRLGLVDPATNRRLMDDVEGPVVLAAIGNVQADAPAAVVDKLVELANDPAGSVASAAAQALTRFRPKAGPEQDRFDLNVEHPYIRAQIVARLARATDAASLALLEAACSNRNARARVRAIEGLLARAPDRGRVFLRAGLQDPSRWARLLLAARMATEAAAGDAAAIRAAMESEIDPAAVLYLQDALARAEGRPAPEPRPAARSVAARKGLTWMTGLDSDCTNSPFGGYYVLDVEVGPGWRDMYRSGKIFFGRATPVGNPGTIITDPSVQDRYWRALIGEVTDDKLPYLDGLVYGEETMSFGADALWASGWRLFCRDAGIEAERVAGKQENLSAPEKSAWHHWGLERCVDGFNELYDYTKLRLGKLRPGLQVATFLPGQGGISPADFRWKFDVGGIYDYKGCNRIAAYMLVRRIKTVWPERPVIWLSLGIGGYEMNPVSYTQKTPEGPMLYRSHRCYADSVSAWAAGADPGWFSTWIFVSPLNQGGRLSGVQIVCGDIFGNTNLLARAIAYSFAGVNKKIELKELKVPQAGQEESEEDAEVSRLLNEGQPTKAEEVAARLAADRVRMYDGFKFYGRHVYDCGRVFSDLPRVFDSYPALAVWPGISVWTVGGAYPQTPGFALLNRFDFLCDINKVVEKGPDRYRLIAVRDPGALRDETIAALTRWLKETPGLLYVSRNIAADNAAEASTAADHDGRLANDWPWESSVACAPVAKPPAAAALPLTGPGGDLTLKNGTVGSTFTCSDAKARALLSSGGKPVLVLWRDPAFKGAVLFDGVEQSSRDYLEFLAGTVNGLAKEGVGLALEGAMLQQVVRTNGVLGAASSSYFAAASTSVVYEGVDFLIGQRNPTVGPSRSGAIVAEEFTGRHVAAHAGVSVLADLPYASVKADGATLVVESPGLMRAGSKTGRVKATVNGAPLPAPATNASPWILYGTTDAAVELPIGKEGAGDTILYFRSRAPVTLSADTAQP